MNSLTDTHCHIHETLGDDDVAKKWHDGGVYDPVPLIEGAKENGVTRLICVGCTPNDSEIATKFVQDRPDMWASIGIHPHEAKAYDRDIEALERFKSLAVHPKVVGVGECGLDYFYNHSPKVEQARILRFQIELALAHNLPMIFHVREAFDDFWKIFDEYKGIRGVIHSFTASEYELNQILERGLYVGLNGIMTFTKHVKQLEAAKEVPISKLLLETDAPFLTPQPLRGTMNEPKYVRIVAEFLAKLRGETLDELAEATTKNAQELFGLS